MSVVSVLVREPVPIRTYVCTYVGVGIGIGVRMSVVSVHVCEFAPIGVHTYVRMSVLPLGLFEGQSTVLRNPRSSS